MCQISPHRKIRVVVSWCRGVVACCCWVVEFAVSQCHSAVVSCCHALLLLFVTSQKAITGSQKEREQAWELGVSNRGEINPKSVVQSS